MIIAQSQEAKYDIISIFFNMKKCCVFSLESPHRGDSNEYTQHTIFNVKKKIPLIYPKSVAMDFCSKGLEYEFETSSLGLLMLKKRFTLKKIKGNFCAGKSEK